MGRPLKHVTFKNDNIKCYLYNKPNYLRHNCSDLQISGVKEVDKFDNKREYFRSDEEFIESENEIS